MIQEPNTPSLPKIAVIALVPREINDDSQWLGIILSKMVSEHLRSVGLPVIAPDQVALQMQNQRLRLPLVLDSADRLRDVLGADALVHGGYVLDEETKLLGFNLLVEAPDIPRIPLEVAAPLSGFGRFMERITLAIVEQLGVIVTDVVRTRIHDVPRPASFDAYRQLARAYAAWSRDQYELALAALSSARSLDPDFEEIAALQIAVAREADDFDTVRDAFIRWTDLAKKQGRKSVAGERLMQMGHWLTDQGEWVEARRIYDEARKQFFDEKYEPGMAQALNNQANLDLMRGKSQASLQHYRRSLHVFEEDDESVVDVAITLYNVALAHKNLGQREEAAAALTQALTLAHNQNNVHLEGLCLALSGALYDDAGRWGQARSDYDQAIRLLKEAGDVPGRAIVINHQAMIFKQQGAFDRAEKLMNEALELLGETGNVHSRAIMWLNLADLYFSMEEFDQSWEYAERANTLFSEIESDWQVISRELIGTLENIQEARSVASTAEGSESGSTQENEGLSSLFGVGDLPVSTSPRPVGTEGDKLPPPPAQPGADRPTFLSGPASDENSTG